MWGWLRRMFSPRQPETQTPAGRQPAPHPRPQSRFDTAQGFDSRQGFWAGADLLSVRSANNLFVRARLRSRARYECGNNGYAGGLVLGLADDTVGTGPRLQVLLESSEQNAALEAAWNLWADGAGGDPVRSVGLASKLHLMAQARCRDGESFGVLTTNDDLLSPVKLDFLVLECDQVATPWAAPVGPIDGVELDGMGRPAYWHVLRQHPGELSLAAITALGEFDRVPASRVLHWSRPTRPGEIRAVPEITASLPVWVQMRAWTQATLDAAHTAAKFTAVLRPDPNDPLAEQAAPGAPFEELPLSDGMMTTLPPGAALEQMRAEHPTTTYPDFKRELLKEAGRPVRAPYNKAAGDSSPYNYSSAQMDEGDYWSGIAVVRDTAAKQVLDRLFAAFLAEARMIPGFLPDGLPEAIPHTWHWRSADRPIDPLKESKAESERLVNGTTTLARIYAEAGLDWEAEIKQLAKEVDLCASLGLVHPFMKVAAATAPGKGGGDVAPEDGGEEDGLKDDQGDGPPEDNGQGRHAFRRNGFHRGGTP